MENIIPQQAGLSHEQEQAMAMLTSNVGRAEYVYKDRFKMSRKEGEDAPAPIEMFYKLMDGMPNILKKTLAFDGAGGYLNGMQQYRQRRQLKVGHVDVSGFSDNRIHLRDDHDRRYLALGYIELDKGTILHNGDQLDDYVEIYFRIRGRTFMARKVVFIARPILRFVLPRIINKVYAMAEQKKLEKEAQATQGATE